MKKKLLLLLALSGVLTAQADDYGYLTFETIEGAKASVPIASLSIAISGTSLTASGQTFDIENLSRMYFTTTDESTVTTGISQTMTADLDAATEIYDLRGHRVSREQMRRGVYVVKTSKGTYKVNVK